MARLNKKDLADALGITRPTLDTYLEMDGAPKRVNGGYDPEEVAAFVKLHAGSEKTHAKVDPAIRELKKRELKLKCDRLEHQIKKDKDRYVEKAKLGPLLYNLGVFQRSLLQQKLERDLANLIHGITPQIIAHLRETTDGVCAQWREGVKDFTAQVPPCSKCGWKDEQPAG